MEILFPLILCINFVIIIARPEAEKNVFCFHGKWAHFRKGNGHFGITEIDPFLCTHLVYTYFGIDSEANIVIRDLWLDLEENYGFGNLRKLEALKKVNPKLKILMDIGGWNEGTQTFSSVANDGTKVLRFVKNCLDFLQKYNFDGLTLDWEYPGQREGSRSSDRNAFTHLVKSLAKALHEKNLILTAVVDPLPNSAETSYDIPQMSKYVDFVMLKTIDMHGSWAPTIGHNSPLYPKTWEVNMERFMNIQSAVFHYLKRGTPSEKLIFGVPTYGRGFQMSTEGRNIPGSPHSGPSTAGIHSNDPGFLGFNELCEKRLTENWQDFWDEEQKVPFSTREDQWIGYDNEESLRIKARFVKSFKLGGLMVSNIETDDFKGFCGRGTFPLLKAINEAFKEKSPKEFQRRRKFCPQE
ncbi:chitinase-3-like protein 1 [Phlebotomus argentipes]|uniref:chitinase-3-like protein 1 n=1 Tax=Phlebotomus argentipes TaxID=94469 RepID=UPI0028937108|nr:chitinase-3-like protein 1 [Phlebotomus argentipes]